MTVFNNRFRCAYLRKRSKKTMLLGTLLVLAIGVLFSIAARHDEEDQRSMAAEFSTSARQNIVASWYESPPAFPSDITSQDIHISYRPARREAK